MKKSTFKITAFSIIAVLIVALSVTAFSLAVPAGKTGDVNVTLATDAPQQPVEKTNPYITYNTTSGLLRSAHRAGGVQDPENTMKAIKTCLNSMNGSDPYDVDVLEFDLHLTKDRQLILLHDENFDRTTNSVEVWGKEGVLPRDKTLAEIKEDLNFGYWFPYERGATDIIEEKRIYKNLDNLPEGVDANDLRVVTLEEVMRAAKSAKKDYRYIIEIKDKGAIGKYAADQLCALMAQMSKEYETNMFEKVVIGTFNGDISDYLDALNKSEKYNGKINRSAGILDVLKIFLSYLMGRELKEVNYNVLQIPYLDLFPFLGSKSFIDYAHKNNIACQFWTINEADQMETLIKNGADCIMSDNPKLLYEVTNRVKYSA